MVFRVHTTSARDVVARHPRLYLPIARRRYGDRVLGTGTELVIEGFPRSANTFAVTAFELAQPRSVLVAHHLHVPAHVLAATAAGVPTLVLVRQPADAIASAVARRPELDPERLARRYIDLHERILPARDGFLVADFSQVTTDFGAVTERLNARFGTSFAAFTHDDEHVQACFRQIDERSRDRVGGLHPHVVARPSVQRDAMLLEDGRAPVPAHLAARAAELYARFRLLAEQPS
jgi:hypothetical protein